MTGGSTSGHGAARRVARLGHRRRGGLTPPTGRGPPRAKGPFAPAILALSQVSVSGMKNTPPFTRFGGPAGDGLLARSSSGGPERGAASQDDRCALAVLIVGCVAAGSLAGMRTLSNSAIGHRRIGASRRALGTQACRGRRPRTCWSARTAGQTAHAVVKLEAGVRRLTAVKRSAARTAHRRSRPPAGRTVLVVVTLRGDPNNADARAAQVQDRRSAGVPGRIPASTSRRRERFGGQRHESSSTRPAPAPS